MDEIITSIQQDILNPEISVSVALYKAKVLAYQLRNERFKQWVKSELDGYDDERLVPDYRVLRPPILGMFHNGYNGAENVSIPMYRCPESFCEVWGVVRLPSGIRVVEDYARQQEPTNFVWPAEAVAA